jgi:hypothetical protein
MMSHPGREALAEAIADDLAQWDRRAYRTPLDKYGYRMSEDEARYVVAALRNDLSRPGSIQLQARKVGAEKWIDIFPAQVRQFSGSLYEMQAIEAGETIQESDVAATTTEGHARLSASVVNEPSKATSDLNERRTAREPNFYSDKSDIEVARHINLSLLMCLGISEVNAGFDMVTTINGKGIEAIARIIGKVRAALPPEPAGLPGRDALEFARNAMNMMLDAIPGFNNVGNDMIETRLNGQHWYEEVIPIHVEALAKIEAALGQSPVHIEGAGT